MQETVPLPRHPQRRHRRERGDDGPRYRLPRDHELTCSSSRRKLAAVRLQVTPHGPTGDRPHPLREAGADRQARCFAQKSAAGPELLLQAHVPGWNADGHPELFYPAARPMLPPPDYDLAAEVRKARRPAQLSVPEHPARSSLMLQQAAQRPGGHLHQDDPLPDGAGSPRSCRH